MLLITSALIALLADRISFQEYVCINALGLLELMFEILIGLVILSA